MDLLSRLCRYDAWANAKVFEVCSRLDPALLNEQAGGTLGTLTATLGHLLGVAEAYLAMLRGEDYATSMEARDAYLAHDLPWFAERARVIDEGYAELAAKQDPALLARELRLPWASRPLPAPDALCQVLTHSAHHRAQVLSALGSQGIQVPDIDYLLMWVEAGG